jgi:glutamine amidotransferase
MTIVVDYKLGNLFSVAKAFELLGEEVLVSGDPKDLARADRIVLPGVGAFPQGMRNLEEAGLSAALREEVAGKKKPFLGICLGMQLTATRGFEHEECDGLGWIEGEVRLIAAESAGLKVPHIGWNDVSAKEGSRLFRGIRPHTDFYFVHSYAMHCAKEADVAARTSYGEDIVAAVEHENIYAVQFHPEKSQEAGQQLLENFLRHA